MAEEVTKAKVKIVITEKFHDLNKDAEIDTLAVEYMGEHPNFYYSFTMEEEVEENMMDGAILENKIQEIVDNNIDVQLEQP